MLRKALTLPALALLTIGTQSAFAYDVELAASVAVGEVEIGSSDADTTAYGFGGEYYFGGVDDSKGPLAEAAFVDRSSSIFAAYSYAEFDFDGGEVDTDQYSFGGRYVDKDSGWFVGGAYTISETDDIDVDTYGIRFGRYIADYTTLALSYEISDSDGSDSDDIGIDIEHIEELSGERFLSLDIQFLYTDPDIGDELFTTSGSLTYYINRNLGFGGSLSATDADEVNENSYSLFVTWFPSTNFELSAAYSMTDIDDSDTEISEFLLGAAIRF